MNPRIAHAHERSTRVLIALLIAGALALFALSTTAGANPWAGMPSPAFWASHPEADAKIAEPAGVYQPNTDSDFMKHVRDALAKPQTGRPWRNAGPFGGVQDIPSIGSGAELFLPIGGIGTAIAADPTDPTGNTVYLGTHGGLWKSTDGGKTETNISDGKFLRDSIGAIAVDPHNGKNVFVGTGVAINTLSDDAVGTGIYVSHDGGKTFTRPDANTHGYGVNQIVVSPNGTIFAGTNYGLWRSTDHGASFVKIDLPTNADHSGPATAPLGSTVTSIVLRPSDPNEVTVAVGWARGKEQLKDAQGNAIVIGTGNGLYRSASNGTAGSFKYLDSTSQLTWQLATSDPVGRISLAYANNDIMWALVQDAGRSAGKTPGDLPTLPNGLSGTAYGAVLGQSVLNGLYHSTDDASNWQLEATTQTLATALGGTTTISQYPLYAPGIQSQYNNWVVPDPTDVNKVYIGLEEVYSGTLNDPTGALPAPSMTWTALEKYANLCGFLSYPNTLTNASSCPSGIPFYGGGTTHPDQHAAVITKAGSGYRFYSGNDGGWFAQTAHALTDGSLGYDNDHWESLNQPATVLPWDVSMLQDGSVVMALQDNGTIRLRKDGTAYNVCGGDGVIVFPGPNPDSYYCGIPGQFILGTTDDFKHATLMTPTLSPGLPGLSGASFLSPWVVDRTDPNHILAGAGVIAETTQGINSETADPSFNVVLQTQWVQVFAPPARADGLAWDSSAAYTQGNVSYVGMCALCRPAFSLGSASNPSLVHSVIATNVQKGCTAAPVSTSCWHLAKSLGLPHQQISGIAVDPKDPRTLYVSVRQEIVLGSDPHVTGDSKVFVSHDAGDHFTDITGDLPRVDAHSLWLRNGQLIVANDVGVFISKVGSAHWDRLGSGLPQVPFRSMKLDLSGRYLIAGAYGRGAWVYDFGSAAAAPAVSGGIPTKVQGEKIGGTNNLAATGTESTLFFGIALMAMAAVLSRRLRRTP